MNAHQPAPRKHGLLARMYIVFLRLRFHLFQRHRYNRLTVETLAGKPFVILPGVFNPTLFFSSAFFVQTFSPELIPPGATVLDMGTGSGVGAVLAAQWAAQGTAAQGSAGRVVAVDVNPAAVRCARINALLNGVDDRVEVRAGDLFAPVAGAQFDVVLFNPPYISGTAKNDLEKAFFSTGLATRFATELRTHLNPDGYALVILSDIDAPFEAAFLAALAQANFSRRIVRQKKLPTETLTIYQILRGAIMNASGQKMV